MKSFKLIGLSMFLVGVLSYNISTISNTSNVTLGDLSTMAMAYPGEGTGGVDYKYEKMVALKDIFNDYYYDCEKSQYKNKCTQAMLNEANVHYDGPYC